MKSWTTTLERCPYCDILLNISSLSTRSMKESVKNVLTISKYHLDKCRVTDKELSFITIKEREIFDSGVESVKFNYHKILV